MTKKKKRTDERPGVALPATSPRGLRPQDTIVTANK